MFYIILFVYSTVDATVDTYVVPRSTHVLCCSGLDTVTTTTTLKLLRKLAHEGRTVVCTIHQPSASLFSMFDHVYVLAAGLCVYQGATEELVPFLASTGLNCPTHYNPADFGKFTTYTDDGVASQTKF